MVNVPDYFFVSTNVAKAYPALLESAIVLSYRSHLPNECLAQKWKKYQFHREQQVSNDILSFIQKTFSFLISLAAIEIFDTVPIELQRMFIRFTQPMVLSGAALTCLKLKDKFGLLYSVFIILGPAIGITVLIWVYFNHHTQERSRSGIVQHYDDQHKDGLIAEHKEANNSSPIVIADRSNDQIISLQNMLESFQSSISCREFSLSNSSMKSDNLDDDSFTLSEGLSEDEIDFNIDSSLNYPCFRFSGHSDEDSEQ
jgi:hypothetical protein